MAKFQAIICHRSFAEIKMLGLWYVAGAIPGKSLKRKTTESDDKREKTKMYGLRWEQRHHDMQNMAKMMMMMTFVKIGVMKLKTGLTYMNIQENKILHLNCVNFFWSSKKWFVPVKVLPLLNQMSSEVQGTFGMTAIMVVTVW
jgi:hypothetical protein